MQRKRFQKLMVVVCAAAFAALRATRADVVTISTSKDNTIFDTTLNNSLGAGQAVVAGANAQASPRRGLIDFDIAASIPARSTITSVQLTLFLNSVPTGSSISPTIRLYRLGNDWGEGSAGSNVNGASTIGQGFAAGEGDATWNARHFSATTPTLWNSPGGDFAATDSAAMTILGATLNTPYTWASTPALISDVQNWLDNPSTNFGWTLKSDQETSASSVRGFWTREAARTGQGAFAPQVQVTYTAIPEPIAISLLGIGLLGLRRKK